MNDQQSASPSVQEPEQSLSEKAREIANMDETDWMTMLMEMRIASA